MYLGMIGCDVMTNWSLFRYRNSDGSSKDWAVITNPDGSISTRWGKTAARLPSINTRNGIRQFDIEKQKQAKGYVFVAEVAIDHEGNVSFPLQHQNHGNQPVEADENHQAEAEQSKLVVGTLYWHIDCQAEHEVCVEWGSEVRRLVGAIRALPNDAAVSENTVEPEQAWAGWQQLLDLSMTQHAFTQSGQIQQTYGVMPWLLLMALKFRAFTGVDIGIATENGRELSADLKAEPEVLAFFGTDLDSVRPMAERLSLLQPKLNLALAMAEQDDSWF
jgi:hypothetical protein